MGPDWNFIWLFHKILNLFLYLNSNFSLDQITVFNILLCFDSFQETVNHTNLWWSLREMFLEKWLDSPEMYFRYFNFSKTFKRLNHSPLLVILHLIVKRYHPVLKLYDPWPQTVAHFNDQPENNKFTYFWNTITEFAQINSSEEDRIQRNLTKFHLRLYLATIP